MTKIYNANTFLEADQIIATLQSQHISAEKREISDMNVITGKMETAFEIYVSEENAVKCIEQMSISDTDTSGRSRAARIYAIAALGIIAVMICLSLVL
ncbi:MAG: hypothetical protein KH210_06365 [Roseburia sp.]|nr:hypothetical protein [Roseburia sp.]